MGHSTVWLRLLCRWSSATFEMLPSKTTGRLSILAWLALAATDGSLSLRKELMGASFVVFEKPGSAVSLQFSASVGGPLATLRSEAVGLLEVWLKNKSLLKNITAVNTKRATKLHSTIFVRETLMRPYASVVRKTIAKCNDPTVRCWMRIMNDVWKLRLEPTLSTPTSTESRKQSHPAEHSATVGT